MADISKITFNNKEYNLKDEYARSKAEAAVDTIEQAIVGLAGIYRFEGSVETFDDLPTQSPDNNLIPGTVYNVSDTGINYAWTGTEWDALGGMTEDTWARAEIVKLRESTYDKEGIKEYLDEKADKSEVYTKSEVDEKTDKSNLSNALKAYASGEAIFIDDISSVEHTVTGRVSGNNIDPTTVSVIKPGKNLFPPIVPHFELSDGSYTEIYEDGTFKLHYEGGDVLFERYITLPAGTYYLSDYTRNHDIGGPIININYNVEGGYKIVDSVNNNIIVLEKPSRVNIIVSCYPNYFKDPSNIVGDYVVSPMLERGTEFTGFESYREDIYTPSVDGTIEISSSSPTMTISSNTPGAVIEIEYNRDINKALNEYVNKVAPSPANITIYSDKWEQTDDGKMWYQEVQVNNATITPYSKVDLQLSAEQVVIFYEKDLAFVTENDGGVVTVYCIGTLPKNTYTIQATVSEVVVNG